MTDKVYVVTQDNIDEGETYVIGVFASKEKAEELIDKEKEEIFNDPFWGPWECCSSPDKDCVKSMFEFDINGCEVVT